MKRRSSATATSASCCTRSSTRCAFPHGASSSHALSFAEIAKRETSVEILTLDGLKRALSLSAAGRARTLLAPTAGAYVADHFAMISPPQDEANLPGDVASSDAEAVAAVGLHPACADLPGHARDRLRLRDRPHGTERGSCSRRHLRRSRNRRSVDARARRAGDARSARCSPAKSRGRNVAGRLTVLPLLSRSRRGAADPAAPITHDLEETHGYAQATSGANDETTAEPARGPVA